MNPIVTAAIKSGLSLVFGQKLTEERIAAPSTAVGAALLTGAGVAGSGNMGFPDGSMESYIVMVIMGIAGIYGIVKKKSS